MTAIGSITFLVGCAAVAEDLARRCISNWTSGTALAAGLLIHTMQRGWNGAVLAALGAAVGFSVFLIFYLLNGMGGGDVKLMAGFGGLLGPALIWRAAWIAAVTGGLMAVGFAAVLAWRARRERASGRIAPAGPLSPNTIPYAPAIVAGVWLVEFALG
ncbi:MAG: peptidase prepilin type [Bryobacterales bacterium]|nr:peptidase prepilin type [Bryobacterales bacterium]